MAEAARPFRVRRDLDIGLLWGVHVTKAWPFARRRWSGGVTTALVLWLTVSGYLLYYMGSETARTIVSVLHWTTGLIFPLVFFWHRFNFRRWRAAGKKSKLQSMNPAKGEDAAVYRRLGVVSTRRRH